MYNSEDLERFYFQYQTEALPHGESLQSFCVKNKVPYNIFQKWYRDTRKKVVEVQVDGAPVIGHEEQSSAIDQPQPVSPGRTDHPVRIWVEIRISNGLHLSQKKFKLPGFGSYGRETGGVMLSVTGLNHFFFSVVFLIWVVSTAVCCLSFVNGFTGNPGWGCLYSHVSQSQNSPYVFI